MGTMEKLLKRFLAKPKDFTFDELIRLLHGFEYFEEQGSGSRVVFMNKKLNHKIKLHKPHPGNVLKRYQIDLIENELANKSLL